MSSLHALTNEHVLERAEATARRDETRETEERWELVRELHRRTDSEIFDAAAGWCASDDPLLRALAADTLAQLAYNDDYAFAGRSAPLLMGLLEDAEIYVATSAIVALGHLRAGDVEGIAAFAAHETEGVREAVAFSLGPRDEAPAREALIRLSADPSRDVRNWATFGLGASSEADNPDIRSALAARLEDEDEEVRGEAIVGLANRGDERVVPLIAAELAGDDVSKLAVEAAAALPRRAFLSDLESLLSAHPKDEGIRFAVDRCREAD